jgi:hypothetical protein
MHAIDVVGYTFEADIYHPACLISYMVATRHLSPAAREMQPEQALDQHAAASAIDREDEYTFDSDDFPKVVFVSQVEDDTCGRCGDPLI